MELLTNILTIIYGLNILAIIALIFFERKNPTLTWAWIMVLTFLPIVGFIIYLFIGHGMSKHKMFKNKIIDDNTRKEYLNEIRTTYVYDVDSNKNQDLITMNTAQSKAIYSQHNRIKVIFDGKEKYEELFESIKKAKKYIHVEYYIIQKDEVGLEFIKILSEKAKEGVEVKLLYDAMGSNKLNRKKYFKEFKANGGKCAAFFPSVIPYLSFRINYRNHGKIVVIDGEVAFTGGFNIGKEHICKDKKIGYWRDTHLKIEGEGVEDIEERFLLDWIYASREKINDYSKYFPKVDNIKEITGMQVVSCGPDNDEQHIRNGYLKIINNARKNVYIQTPYFVPDETMLNSLKISALSGVDVRLMIPGKPDHKTMFWAANSYIGELLEAGVKVYYYQKGFIHAKTIVADGAVSSVGTANMDIRSFKLNFEVNCFIYNKEIAEIMENQFEEDMKASNQVEINEFSKRSVLDRLVESVVRLVSPLL